MSATGYWRPVPPEKKGKTFGCGLRRILHKRYGIETDGPRSLCAGDIEFLSGVESAGGEEESNDALVLIKAIEQYGCVEVWVEY